MAPLHQLPQVKNCKFANREDCTGPMQFDPLRLQRACQIYARGSRNAALCMLAAFVLMLGGIFAALISAPVDAATKVQVETLADAAQLPEATSQLAFASQQADFSDFPDLFAELAVLNSTGPPSAAYLDGGFAPASPFIFGGSYDGFDTALDCLAAAAWYETGNDPAGQRSVIQVVLNRVRHPSFPKSVCAVVFQGSERATGCQFSFTCDGSMERRFPSQVAWTRAREQAMAALSGVVDPTVGQATHFHADYVTPWWSSQLEPLTQVGAHIFYRWPGERGRLLGSPVFAPEVPAASLKDLSVNQAGTGAAPDMQYAEFPSVGPDIAALETPFTPELEALETPSKSELEAHTPRPQAVVTVVSSPSVGGTTFLEVTDETQSDRWALDALAKCDGHSVCQVVGYASTEQLDSNRLKSAEARERPVFLFLRDPVSQMDVALWDCERITRPNPEECLPATGAGLNQLMREPLSQPIPAAA
jgi:hypothetical protein